MSVTAIESDATRDNLRLLISLRWLAVAGQIAAIGLVHLWLGISLPLAEMGLVVLFLVGLNLVSLHRALSAVEVTQTELGIELLLDVAALTLQLYLSGGATNPFISLFLLQVILGAVLLAPPMAWVIVLVTSLSFIWLTHFYRPIDFGTHAGGHHHGERTFFDLHVQGMFLCFILASVLAVAFVTRITSNLRRRDAHLAEARRRAAEEEHIVRIGLLASGAAHELGTPLATLSVILNDWQHMPRFRDDPAFAEELAEMQTEIGRCKSIVSHILMVAGEARAEEAQRSPLSDFLDEMVESWVQSRRPSALDYANATSKGAAITGDGVIQQALFNVLDNALEASPAGISVRAAEEGEDLVIRVTDQGPGFAPDALAQLGRPFQSSKGEAGRGLGLFLTINVLRKLGGDIEAGNLQGGGAFVELRLPLEALAVDYADVA
ncbi:MULTISPECIES: ATP-binding protein [Xanthobacter]|uniref:ATP-binding protein n=1 Tax=Xanthobacter TaxID=279 RepID=UPI00145EC01B|nr:ATP-binding protein [Xanthobacter sp. SG618]NMN57663.1 two-component system sensor histidine kinase RegB [Xanthobacter sp. SG618]